LPAAAALGALALELAGGPLAASGPGGFTAKGASTFPAGIVELACSEKRPCRAGDTLLFMVDAAAAHGYLNARAQRIEPASPERIRLFPTEAGASPRVAAGGSSVVASQGVRLGQAFEPGSYRVEVWFTDDAPSADPRKGRKTFAEFTIEK
jgi:hypothetical protein